MNKGTFSALGAYLSWGLLPIYWKVLHNISPAQIISHRVIWSFLFVALIITFRKEWKTLRITISDHRTILIYLAAAILLTFNWLVYVWGVNSDHVVETSLGYFINPLVSVFLGVIFLRERLRPGQWIPVSIAAVGVIYLAIVYGRLPWIALALATSFSFYGLVKKTAPLGSLYGLTLETGLAFLPCALFLIVAELTGQGAFGHSTFIQNVMMVGTGIITAIPLLMFASAARQIRLVTLGILQYIAPTCQFLIGVAIYREPFNHHQLIGFSFVWLALLLFWIEGLWVYSRSTRQAIDMSKPTID